MAEKASPSPVPNEKLVRIFDTEQEAEAVVVRGLLESVGIDCDVVGENSLDVLPVGAVSVLVREEDAARARQLLEEYERSPEQAREEQEALDDPQ
ncbi:MAG: DUF2007 domain-containing protein, partial [Acidobacteria bacterium]|nr:DUF2007 domain-containing protein [Acidobacteriota bacterium]